MGFIMLKADCREQSSCFGKFLLFFTVFVFACLNATFTYADDSRVQWIDVSSQLDIKVSNPVRSRRSPDAKVYLDVLNKAESSDITKHSRLIIKNLNPSVSISNFQRIEGGDYVLEFPDFTKNRPLLAGKSLPRIELIVKGGGANSFDFDASFEIKKILPSAEVKILTPKSLITVGSSPVTVTGSIYPANASLTVNGVKVAHSNGVFSANVAVTEGHNTIVSTATLGDFSQVSDSISVSLDLTPPYITIESHKPEQVVYTNTIKVTGLINDIVRGTVEESQANVTVNGKSAVISNRSYSASDIQLNEGMNVIKVTATDQVGNVGSKSINVIYKKPTDKKIIVEQGQGQEVIINEVAGKSLKVKVIDANNKPIVKAPVVFRVVQGAGAVAAETEKEGRAVVVETNNQGVAETKYRAGLRVGVANHKITAKVVGVDADVVFAISAKGKIGNKLSVNSGNNQRGIVGQALPEPFVVVVTDDGANVVKGARVKFEVVKGNGNFGEEQNAIELITDSDGRAAIEYYLGNVVGLDAQRVTATLIDSPKDKTITAGFMATAFVPDDPGKTTISGIVLDNQDNPIPGVVVRVDGTSRKAVVDEQGQFKIVNAPVGPVHLVADGSTAKIEGEYPDLSYNIVTVAGVDNPLAAPIYMVKLNTENAVFAGPEDAVLELDKFPGFKLEIAKDSVTFPDGARSGYVSVTPVNASKVPMAPPNGMQPQFIVTIQPTGTKFDPPARLSLPNVDGHKAGAQVEMYSYDHDLEEFVSVGLGTVSEDASVVKSNIGVGVVKAGWHCGSQPSGSGCCDNKSCDYCFDKVGCPSSCQFVKDRPAKEQVPGNCQLELCGGSRDDDNDIPPKECGICKDGKPDIDETVMLKDQKPDDCKDLYCGGDFKPNDSETSELKKTQECKKCKNGKPVNDDGPKCGDGSPAQSCYTCKGGECGNQCEASSEKDTMEAPLPGFVANTFVKVKHVVNSTPVFSANLKDDISLKKVEGEKCCKDCSKGSDPAKYTEISGFAGLKGDINVTVPGLGFAKKLPEKRFLGFAVQGEVFFTAIGASIKGDLGGTVTLKTDECGEACGSFNAGMNLSASIGPQVKGNIKLVDCDDEKCEKNTTLTEVAVAGSATADIKGSVGAKAATSPDCGKTCVGFSVSPVSLNLKASATFTLWKIKRSVSWATPPWVVYNGTKSGDC